MEHDGLTTQFKVQITGGEARGGSSVTFVQCDGIQSEVEVIAVPEGGRLDSVKTVRGQRRSQTITLGQGVSEGSGGKDLWSWYQDVCDSSKPLKKRTLTISVVDPKGSKTLAQWELKGAWPFRWSGPLLSQSSSSPTIEQIGFSYESLKRS